MVWNRVKEHPILRSSSILASTELASFQFGLTRVLKAFMMADSVTEENRARKMVCTVWQRREKHLSVMLVAKGSFALPPPHTITTTHTPQRKTTTLNTTHG